MRLSVTSNPQNALFRRMRFFSPAQTRRRLTEKRILAGRLTEKRTLATATSRKSAPCTSGLTERRTLAAPPGRTSPKDALWRFWSSQNASFRDVKPPECAFP